MAADGPVEARSPREPCPWCGHVQVPRWARVAGGLVMAVLVAFAVALGLGLLELVWRLAGGA